LNSFFRCTETKKKEMDRIFNTRRKFFTKYDMLSTQFYAIFRFEKEDIPKLIQALKFPKVFKVGFGHCASGEEVLLIVLARLAYPGRLNELSLFF